MPEGLREVARLDLLVLDRQPDEEARRRGFGQEAGDAAIDEQRDAVRREGGRGPHALPLVPEVKILRMWQAEVERTAHLPI